MHGGKQCPVVTGGTAMRDVIYEMSEQRPRHDLRRRRRHALCSASSPTATFGDTWTAPRDLSRRTAARS